jgi:hypothetical protein
VAAGAEPVALEDLHITLPDGTRIVATENLAFPQGESALLAGPSGEDRYDCSHVKRGLALFDGTGCGAIAGSPEPGSDRDRCRRGPDQN